MDTAHPTRGRIGRTHHESTPWYDPIPAAAPGAPNVVYVVLDDVGYADLGCYGSEIETPVMDALAGAGLRYSNFHTTTLCSPTRACLLTGRNHHAVGMRYLANVDMGWPNGRGAISPKAATLAEMLKDAGYATFVVGKWHLAPTENSSAAGPFDQWPLGRGFERFYGFMNGGTDQFFPELVEDNRRIRAPGTPEEGYHLSADLADQAIDMLANQTSLTPDKPFFLYLSFGAGHFPHQAPPHMLAKYRGRYDEGWDVARERRLAKQKAMGLVPDDVELPPSNPGVARWDDLDADQKLVAARLQETYAAFLDYTDQQLGRVIDFLKATGAYDNTLIVLISDNGASIDCGPEGTVNVLRWFNGLPDSTAVNRAEIDKIGGPESYQNYPWGWAQASNTPLKLYKSYTHGGGVRDPLIISWPKRIKDGGAIRHQFHHVVDLTPTVLELAGVTAPEVYRGHQQIPIHGESLAYTFDAPEAPTRKTSQYFEMYGHRSIWHDGWKAVTNHARGDDFEAERWELYHLDSDFNEMRDLAATHPDKLAEMRERWWAEAGRYDVLPLDDRDVLFKAKPRPTAIRAQTRFTLRPGIAPIPAEAAPMTQDVSHRIAAELTFRPGDQGILVAFGSCHGGYALFVQDDRLVYAYNHCGELTHLVSDATLPAGPIEVAFVFDKTGPRRGVGRLLIGDAEVARADFPRTLNRISLQPMEIGRSPLPPISPRYKTAFPFTGSLMAVRYAIGDDRDAPPPSGDID
jgi:arylsulfatase